MTGDGPHAHEVTLRRLRRPLVFLACVAALMLARPAGAQQPATPPELSVELTDQTATVTYFNRPIVRLRARVLGRSPQDRALVATRLLDEIVADGITGPVETRPFLGGALLTVNGRGVLGLVSADVEPLTGETMDTLAAASVMRLQQALQEAGELRAPRVLLLAAIRVAAVTLVAIGLLWLMIATRRRLSGKLAAIAEAKMQETGFAPVEALRASRVLEFQHHLVTAVVTAASLFVIIVTVAFSLRQFPYTRPWGESMRGFLLETVLNLGLGIADAIPGLVTAAIIFVIARFIVRLLGLWFNAAERGQVRARWIYPETAQPTRRLASILVWLFAVVVAYPYLPGSQTEAFKGVSVFLGLMITFGSSGLVNQLMSGLMVVYSRAVRVGSFVRIGEVEGIVTQIGALSLKVRTPRNEEVTIPHGVVVSQTTTDYSRNSDTEGVFISTSVTIGYDAPWRQVEALLLMAADRTAGIRRTPAPKVLQAGLEDFYVKYTLWICLERQESKPFIMDDLHAHIQDLFNEYGVQIMSPNYVFDPSAPKVVPKKDWFAAPAPRDTAREEAPGDASREIAGT